MPKNSIGERNKLLAGIKHLLKMLNDHEKPTRFCRREIKRLCRHLTRLNSPR